MLESGSLLRDLKVGKLKRANDMSRLYEQFFQITVE